MTLLPGFLDRPFAHRALHGTGRPENSLEAIQAAVDQGYGIELDLQPSSDGVAMVFHDDTLGRMTATTGLVRNRSAEALSALPLNGGPSGMPTLRDVLGHVAGRVPLLLELKDQSGALGPAPSPLAAATAAALTGYDGPVAVMSFNPHLVAEMATLRPDLPRGLTTDPFRPDDWPGVPPDRLKTLRAMPDLDRTGACFISHNWRDLEAPTVQRVKRAGLPVLCWTIRSRDAEQTARRIADVVTFEGYAA